MDRQLYAATVVCFSAVRILLKHGADPNLPDEFSNIYLVAREKHLNSLQGMGPFHCTQNHTDYCCSCVIQT